MSKPVIFCGWICDSKFVFKYRTSLDQVFVASKDLENLSFCSTVYAPEEIDKANKWVAQAKKGKKDFRKCNKCPIRFECYTELDEIIPM